MRFSLALTAVALGAVVTGTGCRALAAPRTHDMNMEHGPAGRVLTADGHGRPYQIRVIRVPAAARHGAPARIRVPVRIHVPAAHGHGAPATDHVRPAGDHGPVVNRVQIDGDRGAPAANHVRPADDHGAPAANRVQPAGDHAAPAANRVPPAGAPGTVPGGAAQTGGHTGPARIRIPVVHVPRLRQDRSRPLRSGNGCTAIRLPGRSRSSGMQCVQGSDQVFQRSYERSVTDRYADPDVRSALDRALD